jgi:hypothetical protein
MIDASVQQVAEMEVAAETASILADQALSASTATSISVAETEAVLEQVTENQATINAELRELCATLAMNQTSMMTTISSLQAEIQNLRSSIPTALEQTLELAEATAETTAIETVQEILAEPQTEAETMETDTVPSENTAKDVSQMGEAENETHAEPEAERETHQTVKKRFLTERKERGVVRL